MGAALLWILAKVLREPDREGKAGWRALYGVTALALGAHIVGDLITSFGTIILAPLSDWRAGIGTTFIIDLWFSGIIVAGPDLLPGFPPQPMAGGHGYFVLCGYVAFQYVQKQRALEFGARIRKSQALRDAKVTAHPKPVSPFNWTVFVSDDEAHRFAHVNLVRKEARRFQPGDGFIARVDAPYLPLEQAVWVTRRRYGETENDLIRGAWNAEPLAFFRWFADLPAFDGMSEGAASGSPTCASSRPGARGMPFRYRVCRERPRRGWRLVISNLSLERLTKRSASCGWLE